MPVVHAKKYCAFIVLKSDCTVKVVVILKCHDESYIANV